MEEKIENIHFVEGLDFELPENKRNLIIIDDQMNTSVNDKRINWLFTQGIHHHSTSIVFINQNLFPQGKYSVNIRKNINYLIVLKSPTFKSSVRDLGWKLFPESPRFLYSAYSSATDSNPYTYLVIDVHPKSHDKLRVRSGILPGENFIIYIP